MTPPNRLRPVDTLTSEDRLVSDIVELGGGSSANSPSACELLAASALEHVKALVESRSSLDLGEGGSRVAVQRVDDARALVEGLLRSRSSRERTSATRAALLIGDALLLLSEAEHAKALFELAMNGLDDADDLHAAAGVRVGLAKALHQLRDPRARSVLEDAGELFEEMGDEVVTRSIDSTLRVVQRDIAESPRSFHAGPALRLGLGLLRDR